MLIVKNALSLIVASTIIMIVCSVGYYLNEIQNARRDTEKLVSITMEKHGNKINLSNLSSEREKMLLAIEDPTFRQHHGVDLHSYGAGMTTITQGLVKLIYFPEGFKQGKAKIRQTLIAQYAFDEIISKDKQLSLFLNISYFGNEKGRAIHGFEDAAQTYFSKKFINITDDEFLMLVAMFINPNKLKPYTDKNQERVNRIKKYLSGEYYPVGVLDFDYNGKKKGSFAEEGIMMFLRLITDANPE
jgi:membrane peptidoglycan carboxypeptidase